MLKMLSDYAKNSIQLDDIQKRDFTERVSKLIECGKIGKDRIADGYIGYLYLGLRDYDGPHALVVPLMEFDFSQGHLKKRFISGVDKTVQRYNYQEIVHQKVSDYVYRDRYSVYTGLIELEYEKGYLIIALECDQSEYLDEICFMIAQELAEMTNDPKLSDSIGLKLTGYVERNVDLIRKSTKN